ELLLNYRREKNLHIQQSSTQNKLYVPQHAVITSLCVSLLASLPVNRYSKPVVGTYYFFWYQQYPGKPPKFLISHSDKGQLTSDLVSRLSVKVNETLMSLQISSAAVSDSAVYYCALQPTVTGNSKTLYKNLWSKDNRILHNIH
uniref:Immunoglobulin V-set domain-containing protein n=1 Tax=Haplochromis burtoni TaxID=8153 RepID=A0A3Q2WYZ4_HAPBU